MTTPDPVLTDRRLDAIALLEASIRHDDALTAVLNGSDDVEHSRGVASVLCGMLAGEIRHTRPATIPDFIAWLRRRVLNGEVGT